VDIEKYFPLSDFSLRFFYVPIFYSEEKERECHTRTIFRERDR